MLSVIAKLKAQERKNKKIKEAFLKALPEVEKEAGTLEYKLLRSQDNPLEFVVLEKYTDMDAFMVHGGAPYLGEMIGEWVSVLDGELEVLLYEEIAAKGQ